jgi:type IV secretory pathway VirB10-like protein
MEPAPQNPPVLRKQLGNALRGLTAPQEMKDKLNKVLTRTLGVMDEAQTTPRERVTYARIVHGVIKTLEMAEDPRATPKEQAMLRNIAEGVTEAVENIPMVPPGERAPFMDLVRWTSNVPQTLQAPGARPRDPKDRFRIQETVEENSGALARAHDPEATPEERREARRKLEQLTGSLRNPEYLEFIEEVKRHKAPAVCVAMIKNRTREVGWRDGSLWGLSDSACATTVAEAAESGGRWQALFECVQRNPFSTCAVHVPKD